MSGVVSSASYGSSGSAKACPFSQQRRRIRPLAQGHDVFHAQAGGVCGFVIRLLLAEPFCLNPGNVVPDLIFALSVAPAEDVTHQFSDNRNSGHAAVPGLDGNAGPPGQDVVDVPGALWVAA